MNTEKKQKRIYYTIGDVAEYFGVNESTLRYWEDEFDIITPRRSSRGVRFYNQEDIDNVRLVYYLLKEKGLTLAGAKKQLKENRSGVIRSNEIISRLKSVREELCRIRNELAKIDVSSHNESDEADL
ncbi:MerR family transcriptional regulator [uncultured Coprobacter sp.]|uniref:MerR family transcriptional regulator n=1 Tax=Coprobacter sp. TaxID=1941478 RepID=UPI002631B2EF|nr:MerR family transcriptional regulator [uncultured Coprobacter sp.]